MWNVTWIDKWLKFGAKYDDDEIHTSDYHQGEKKELMTDALGSMPVHTNSFNMALE